jgi:hypothetical protein
LTGGAKDDILIGGAGDDTLTGAGGRDIFDYGFKGIGVVCDTPSNIALNGGFSCSGIELCPATQGVIHIIYRHCTAIKHANLTQLPNKPHYTA